MDRNESTIQTSNSTVYRVENGAVKVLKPTSQALKELSILKAMNHPQIVQLLDFELGEEVKLRMPLYSKVPPNIPVEILYDQCLLILSVLESYNVVHLDFRLNNLGYTDNKIILLDFGNAIILGKNDFVLSSQYPPEYIRAPELNSVYIAKITTRVDVWSLGVLIYHKLYNFYPNINHKLAFPKSKLGEDLKLILSYDRPLASELIGGAAHYELDLPHRGRPSLREEEFIKYIDDPSNNEIDEQEAYLMREHIMRSLNVESDLQKLLSLYANIDYLGENELNLFRKLEYQLYSKE